MALHISKGLISRGRNASRSLLVGLLVIAMLLAVQALGSLTAQLSVSAVDDPGLVKINTPRYNVADGKVFAGGPSIKVKLVWYPPTNSTNNRYEVRWAKSLEDLALTDPVSTGQYPYKVIKDIENGQWFWQMRATKNGAYSDWATPRSFTVAIEHEPVSSNPHTTIMAPTGLVGSKFTVSGLATDDEALNRVYVQLVHRGNSQRYGGTAISLIGKGTEAGWSREYDAVKLNLPDGQYAAHAQAVDMKGNRYDTGWTENFTVDRTGPAISNVAPVTGTNVKADFTVSANVSDPNGVKKVALYVFDQATNTKVKEYPLTNTEGDIWTAQVKLADLRGDAVYDLRFRALDGLDNATYHNNRGGAYLVNVDRAHPTLSNIEISPMINDNISGVVVVSFDLTDASGIDFSRTRVLFTDGPNDTNRAKESSTYKPVSIGDGRYQVTINTRDFLKQNREGKYNLTFRLYDTLGNHRSTKPPAFRGILIDNAGPSMTAKTPTKDETIEGSYRVSAVVTDPSGVQDDSVYARFRDDSGKEYTFYLQREGDSDVFSADVDTTQIGGGITGPNRVSFFARDGFGTSRSSVSESVLINNLATPIFTDPVITLLQTQAEITQVLGDQARLAVASYSQPLLYSATASGVAGSQDATENTSQVRGIQTQLAQTAGGIANGAIDSQEGEAGCWKILGLCWYWWIVIVLGLITLYYVLRAMTKSKKDQTQA